MISENASMNVDIMNIYSNDPLPHSNYKGDHGNSFLIRDNNGIIMMDVGTDPEILLHNMEMMGISPDDISKLVLSHGHYDHTKALPGFLDARKSDKKLPIYAHPQVKEPKRLKLAFIHKDISLPALTAGQEAKVEWKLSEEPQQVSPRISTTGEIKTRNYRQGLEKRAQHKIGGVWELDPVKDDLSIIVKGANGDVVITGCAHAGLLNILDKTRRLGSSDRKIQAVLGGSHMARYTETDVVETGKTLKDEFDAPQLYLNHCTDRLPIKIMKTTPAIDILKKSYTADKVERCCTGSVYTFELA